MKQSLLTSLLLTLSLIFAAPPAWAERNTDYIWFRNTSASAANFYVNYYSSDKWGNNFQYRRTADASWTTLSFKSNISVPAGDSIKIRLKDGVTRTYLNTSTAYNYFNLTAGEWEVGGDLLTLISIEEPKDRRVKLTGTNDHTFMYLFKGSTKLVSAQKLKFPNKLNASCCDQMFNGCTGLVTGPEDLSNIDSIPQYGLFKLFMGCSKLENMPLFPTADSIGNYGCSYMFSDCIKLTDCSDQNLPATKIGQYAYQYMFQKCSTLVNGPDTLHAQYLPNYAYYGMFFACPKLQKAPVIKATSMNKAASNSVGPLGMMFKYAAGSSALSEVEYRMTSWYNNSSSDYFSTYQWLYGVKTSSENTFICSSSLTQGTRSTDRIPTNWIVKYYPIVTFRVSKDRSGNDTEGNWGGGTADTVSITGDWYGDGPFPTATHATKDFRGWVDADGKTITADSSVVARANPVNTITLYANFASSMNFTFDVATNGATWDGEHDNDSTWASGEAAAKVAANTPVKAGYRFVKWHTDATGTGGSDFNPLSLPVVSTTYYAIFVPLCTFNVNTNEGAWSDASTANRAWTKAELTADPTLLTEPVKANYHFVGWNTDKDATTDLLGNDMTNLSSDATTYYAIFTPIYTFAPNGGTWNDESTTDKEFYDSFEVPSIARNGYTFNGWEDESGNELDMEDLPSEPTTYTAQWTAINYTFDVATNEGAWSDESTADSVRTVSGIAALTTPKKDKFTFERWNTSADGTGTDMDAEALPSEATKYYAIFVKVDFFRFIAQNATTIATNRVNSATLPSLSYSIDAGLTWSTFTVGTTSVNLAAGDSILFKGVNASGLNSGCTEDISYKERPSGSYWYFTSTDSISVAGNIMTLVQGSSPTNTIPASNCFAAIMNNLKLVSAAKLVLPTTTTASCYQYIFYRSSVRIAPESLPALNVANYAYRGMFSQCTKLKIAPEIAATTVGEGSMIRMFHTCTALTQAPSELKALTLAANSYYSMFWGCSALRTAPVIYATSMVSGSSDNASMGIMFRQSGINNVSVRMKEWAYSNSYYATNYWLEQVASSGTFTCPSALNNATRNTHQVPSGWTINYIPELTFDVNTNGGTWNDASTTARVLEPETTWTIPSDVTAPANRTFVGWNDEADGTGNWLTVDNQPVISTTAVISTYYAIYAMNLTFNVASVGATWDGSANDTRTYTDVQFRRGEIPSPQRGEDEVRIAWVTAGGDTLKANSVLTPNTVYTPRFAEYLCITAQKNNVQVGTYYYMGTVPFNLYYSTDGMNWTQAATNTRSSFVTLSKNQKLYLRGTNTDGINSTANSANYSSTKYIKFTVSDSATVSGQLMALLHPTNPPTTIPNEYTFAKLFQHINTSGQYCKITDASRLKMPATTILKGSYESMFENTLITGAPDLSHVDTVGHSGMLKMFNGCANLVNSPRLMATRLETNCYYQMFYNCSALRRLEVGFTDWKDDGSGNPKYTAGWMTGTTTNAEHNARFIGPAVLFEHVRNNGHIQTNWKGMDFVLLDDQNDAYYTALKDMDGMALQQVTFKGTFPAKRWITFNVPFDFFIPEDHPFANHVYQFLGADGNATEGFDIHFQGGVFKLEAGMPYLYYGDETLTDFVFAADGENNTILTIDADALNAETVCTGEEEVNTSGAEYRSTVKMTPLPGGDKHYIYLSRNSLYYPHALGNTLYAFSGYFYVPSTGSIAPRVRMMVNGVETNIQVEEFGAEEQAAQAGIKKYILDGTLVIERNGIRYDAHGHKLN